MEKYQYNRIQEVLDEKNKDVYWLQTQLEGETIPRVVRWCKNVKQPTIEELFAIARVLEVDVRELLVPTMTQYYPDNNVTDNKSLQITKTDDEFITQHGSTRDEFIKKYYNEVDDITAICRSNNNWAHGKYQELEIGKTYKVSHIGVLRSSSNLLLVDFGDKEFNVGCFDLYENGEPIGRSYTKDPRFFAPYLRERYKMGHYAIYSDGIEKYAIPAYLRKIEKDNEVKILLAAEFGSRTWGIESLNSDWDIRFVYVHKPEWYKLKDQSNVIEHVYEDSIDFVGWDVRKALTLLKAGNLSILEWMNSAKIYYLDDYFGKQIQDVKNNLFNTNEAIIHYYKIYNLFNERYFQNDDYDLSDIKVFLYFLRGVLSCKWIEEKNSLPPTLYKELIDTTISDMDIRNKIEKLIEIKKDSKEFYVLVDNALVEYAHQQADYYKNLIGTFPEYRNKYAEKIIDSLQSYYTKIDTNNDNDYWNVLNTTVAKTEILPHFQGKDDVRHIIASNGSESFLSKKRRFRDEVYYVGACKLNTVENETKHVLFLFNNEDEEVGRYYLGKELQGKSPAQLVEIKNDLSFFDCWNPDSNKWVPCVGLESVSTATTSFKRGCGLTTYVKNGKWYVVDENDNYVVPPGRYDYIDGFDKCGLARVRIGGKTDIANPSSSTRDRWGIIDTKGNEILPVIYTEIWSFYNKNRETTKVWKGDTVAFMIDGEIQDEYQDKVYRYDFNLYSHELIIKEDWSEGNYNRLDPNYNWDPSDQYSVWDALDGEPEAAGNIDLEG